MIQTSFVEQIFGIKIPRTVRSWNKLGINNDKYLTKHHKWRLKLSIKLSDKDNNLILYLKRYRKSMSYKKFKKLLEECENNNKLNRYGT